MLVGVTCALVGYGFLFGVYPSLVVQVFGINGLSTNWGFMTIAPVISGNIFNILYGNNPSSLFFIHCWTSHSHVWLPLIPAPYLYRKDIRFPFDNFTRRNKKMLWIDSLLQFSLLGHIRRLSTQRRSQSVEHSIWQRHQSESHKTRTRKRHRKGRMRPGSYPLNGRNNIGHLFGFSMRKHVLAWLLAANICCTTGLSLSCLIRSCVYIHTYILVRIVLSFICTSLPPFSAFHKTNNNHRVLPFPYPQTFNTYSVHTLQRRLNFLTWNTKKRRRIFSKAFLFLSSLFCHRKGSCIRPLLELFYICDMSMYVQYIT